MKNLNFECFFQINETTIDVVCWNIVWHFEIIEKWCWYFSLIDFLNFKRFDADVDEQLTQSIDFFRKRLIFDLQLQLTKQNSMIFATIRFFVWRLQKKTNNFRFSLSWFNSSFICENDFV